MATFSKELLSETTNGEAFDISATSSPGTAIHTAVSGSGFLDEIWLWFSNRTDNLIIVTVEFGGTNEANRIVETLEPRKSFLIVPGIPLTSGAEVKAYIDTGSVTCYGYANRRSP